MTTNVLVEPAELPLTLDEVKTYLRIGVDGDDNMLLLILKAAVETVEKRNNVALISRKLCQSISSIGIERAIRLTLKDYYKPAFRPDFKPVTQITATTTVGANGAMVPAPTGLVSLKDGLFFLEGFSTGLEIEYLAGFPDAASVPDAYKLEILEEINRAIQNRDNENSKLVSNNGVRL